MNNFFLFKKHAIKDKRGFFIEIYNKNEKLLKNINFNKINCSFSKSRTLRGLHLQIKPFQQSKLIHVISGSIYDVIVNINKNSKDFGKYVINVLNENEQIFINKNFAHGFLALEDSLVLYSVDNYYNKESERTILWDDKDLNIDWPIKTPIISEKDAQGMTFEEFKKL